MNSVKIGRDGRGYHHGDLRRQLIEVTEQIILEQGVDGFTLREAARRVGVSPAAPAHHFGDARGLLTELALLGFRDFGAALAEADKNAGSDPAQRLRELMRAYVQFALSHPARFQLMFRVDKHDHANKDFVEVASRSYRVLEDAIRAAVGAPADRELRPDERGLLVAAWSMAHGFAHLVLGGELGNPERGGGGTDAILETLLPLVLEHGPSLGSPRS